MNYYFTSESVSEGHPDKAEGLEEPRPHLYAYAGDEEDQTQLLDDMQHVLVQRDAQGTDEDADEKHPSDS